MSELLRTTIARNARGASPASTWRVERSRALASRHADRSAGLGRRLAGPPPPSL